MNFRATAFGIKFGTYGSKFQTDSPWNKFAQGSVVIVDENGGFYGYLTSNKFADKRTTIAAFNQLADVAADSANLVTVRGMFCGL